MGVAREVVQPGDGQNYPQPGDTITIHYDGYLYDESQFDSSRQRDAPFKAPIGVGKLIKGWDEAVPQMSVGEKAILTVTGDYGYGASGFPELIPPHATLVFDVELIAIN
ncbi:hypothetical protein ASPWEDRAFT_53236 [Aspergillus wentii DTO 134E9]|uniref:peptidylprolyl isomerase n=1 Tax=Aspergillus wentii DTO 134E9 TaxID=1073089 RepID=A0A1L9RE58_ASPWE|nr:uncharacterized protein ASPWEDRAFT_53236 [Aspergillus wentii DTO 134E9]OJJ33206.1 hypothetical protein ASPWEDRAFT_53236 [Aspergillus wentii DTO 134E9]